MMNSSSTVFQVSDFNDLWNSTEPRIPKCIQETLFNAFPAIMILLWMIYHHCSNDTETRNKLKDSKAKREASIFAFSSRSIIIFLSAVVNFIHATESLFHQHDDINYIVHPSSIGIYICKSLLLLWILFLIQKKKLPRIPGILWIASIFELVFALIGTYQTLTYFSDSQRNKLVIYSVQLSISFLLFISFCHDPVNPETERKSGLKSRDQSSFGSRLFLWWFTLLVKYGYNKPLDFDDLPTRNSDMEVKKIGEKFHQRSSRLSSKPVKFLPLMAKIFWKELTTIVILQTLCDCLSMTLPILIKIFISFMSSDKDEPNWHGYFIGLLMFLAPFLSSLLTAQVGQISCSTKTRMQLCINATIYGKVLRMRKIDLKDFSTGKIFNLMSVDSSAFIALMDRISSLWSVPLRLFLAAFLMYQTIGFIALIALGLWIGLILILAILTGLTRRFIVAKLEASDRRVKLINEILNGIKSIKFYAWEECLMDKIAGIRQEEVNLMKKLEIIDTILALRSIVGGWICMFTLLSGHMLVGGKPFPAEDMFYILSIVETLTPSMAQIVRLVKAYMTTSASARRLESFMDLKEVGSYMRKANISNAFEIKDGYFSWQPRNLSLNGSEKDDGDEGQASSTEPFNLRGIQISAKVGTFTWVIGAFGSGKSSLIKAVLGEMIKDKGEVRVQEGLKIAVVPQEAWIQNMTLKQNILFGKAFDEDRYRLVLSACELLDDISILPGGDETEIGENGINLSGGQKQRVSLARAVYQDADIYLLDDCLSSLDAQVSKRLFYQVLHSETGLLKDKTRFMATNRLSFLNEVDEIMLIENGMITETGSPEKLFRNGGKVSELLLKYTDDSSHENIDEDREISAFASSHLENKKLIEKEFIVEGQVDGNVYLTLVKKSSKLWLIASIISIPLFLWSSIYSRVILANWTELYTKMETKVNDNWFFKMYTALSVCEAIFSYTIVLGISFAYLKTRQGLHSDLLKGVLYSSIQFFDTTPIGRILNRFSKDMNTIDMVLRDSLRFLCSTAFITAPGIIGLLVLELRMGFVIVALMIVSGYLLKFYMVANRRLKGLESIAKSPIYSHFRETVVGLDSVRAFGVSNRFAEEFNDKSLLHGNSEYLMFLIAFWRDMIMGFLSSAVFASISIFAVLGKGEISGGHVGLLLSYAVRTFGWAQLTLQNISLVSEQVVAVERVLEFTDLPSEGEKFKVPFEFNHTWPSLGKLELRKYTARYRKGLEPSLRDLTALIHPKEKIGVVGRTGAGKSSLALSLFRLIERVEGNIKIDGQDIEDIGLFHLRSRISIIPQDPVIFSGTLRFNLDPFNKYSDEEVWRSLDMSRLKDYFEKFGAGLEYILEEGGKNLSTGQKQLICLARSILKKSKIIVLDEATGSIDMETDFLVQETLREEFTDSTMVIIAHRLDTILDCDRIMVMDRGRLIEFDSPKTLLRDESSKFYALAEDAKLSLDSLMESSTKMFS